MKLKTPDKFTYKGYGRIYVERREDISRVYGIMCQLDPYETEEYFPDSLITTADEYPRVVHTGKFELNLKELKEACEAANVPIVIFDAGYDEWTPGIQVTLTKEDISDLL
jgi:hypothetical protein